MKRRLSRILQILVILVCVTSISKINYVSATDVIASGSCGDNITWSLDINGTLSITGSGDMSGSACAWEAYSDQVKEVVFTGDITSISNYAFKCNSNIQEITLPDTVETIGKEAFAECTNLKTVVFPKELGRIYSKAFYNCTSLQSVDLGQIYYINSEAFAECTSLEKITIREINTWIEDSEKTISSTAKIYGYKNSNIFYYAKAYGRTFTDLNTNETTTEKVTNQSYLDALPKTNLKALGPTSHSGQSWLSNNTLYGYHTEFAYENDTTKKEYQEIKAKVEELTAGCTTDKEKARAILDWVVANMEYKWGMRNRCLYG